MSDLSEKLWKLSLGVSNYTPENMMIELQDLSVQAKEDAGEIIESLKIMLAEVGGCDADDIYYKGYDAAVNEMELWMKENIPNFSNK